MAKLGDLSVGSIIQLNVNGTARDFIVVQQGLPSSSYDSSCDGTWLLMKDCYERRVMDSDNPYYNESALHKYLNNTFINLFDDNIKGAIKQVKLSLQKNYSTSTVTYNTKVFVLEHNEVGLTYLASNVGLGSVLTYFKDASNDKRIAFLNGSAVDWWTRYNKSGATKYVYVTSSGTVSSITNFTTPLGVRPCIVLPADFSLSSFSGYANIGGVNKELSGGYVNIGGVWKEISKAYVNVGGVWKEMA